MKKNNGTTVYIWLSDDDLAKLKELEEWYKISKNSEMVKYLISQEYGHVRALKEGVNNTLRK